MNSSKELPVSDYSLIGSTDQEHSEIENSIKHRTQIYFHSVTAQPIIIATIRLVLAHCPDR